MVTGPGGETNIASDSDAAITHSNYTQVANDLTPNMGDLGGRPPRSNFWSPAWANKKSEPVVSGL